MPFEFTNRKADLTKDTRRVGMPWDLRYTETAGYEDRDKELEDYLASLDPSWTTTFVPQVDQGATTNIAKTITKSQWRYDGSMIEYEFFVIMTGAGTAGSAVTVTLPVVVFATPNGTMGTGVIFDNSTTQRYVCTVETNAVSTVVFGVDQSGSGAGWGQIPAIALAANDQARGLVRYRWR